MTISAAHESLNNSVAHLAASGEHTGGALGEIDKAQTSIAAAAEDLKSAMKHLTTASLALNDASGSCQLAGTQLRYGGEALKQAEIEDEEVARIIGSMAANREGFKAYGKTRMGGGYETLQEYVTRLSGVHHTLTEGSFSQSLASITEQLKTYAEQQVPADLAVLEGWQERLAK